MYAEVSDYNPGSAAGYSSQDSHRDISFQPDEHNNLLPQSHSQAAFETEQSHGSHLSYSQPEFQNDEYSECYDSPYELDHEYATKSEDEEYFSANKNVGRRSEKNEGESLSENDTYENLDQARREVRNTYDYLYRNDYQRTVSNGTVYNVKCFVSIAIFSNMNASVAVLGLHSFTCFSFCLQLSI
jgi:hypothetical protein